MRPGDETVLGCDNCNALVPLAPEVSLARPANSSCVQEGIFRNLDFLTGPFASHVAAVARPATAGRPASRVTVVGYHNLYARCAGPDEACVTLPAGTTGARPCIQGNVRIGKGKRATTEYDKEPAYDVEAE
ncbi:MAG: hypothetical protein AAGD43_11050 [Pseudomonadota bacterium]